MMHECGNLRRRLLCNAGLLLALVLVLSSHGPIRAAAPTASEPPPTAEQRAPAAPTRASPVIVYIADGMRVPDMKRMAAEGKMPHFSALLEQGVDAGPGLIPVAPANSAPNWVSMSTGTSPAVHGATNNLFMDNTLKMTPLGISGFYPSNHVGESIADAAEKGGRKVAVLGWKTFDIMSLKRGVALSPFPFVLTGRGVISNYDIPTVKQEVLDFADALGEKIVYARVQPPIAEGWTNVPPSFSPAHETVLPVSSRLSYNVYIYDSTDDRKVNYDKVLVSEGKNGAQPAAVLAQGEWSKSISTPLGLSHGKFYVKLLDLAPDLSRFRLYFTSVTAVWAWPPDLAEALATRFDGIIDWDDFLPYWAGLIDDATFAEQCLDWYRVIGGQMFPYIVSTYQPDFIMAGTPMPDILQHAFLALATPGTDVYDPARATLARQAIERAYTGADESVGTLVDLVTAYGGRPNTFALSDHGFSATWRSICAHCILRDAGLLKTGDLANSQAVPYLTSGTAQIYINLKGRNPEGIVPPGEYEATRQRVVTLFQQLGPTVVERVLLKEQTQAVTTTMGVTMNMLHPDRTGDVVVFAAPPYTFGPTDALGKLYGDHGFTPNGDVNRFGVFTAAGPDIVRAPLGGPITALDIVPTLAYALGVAPPAEAHGRVLPLFRPPSLFLPFVGQPAAPGGAASETEGRPGR